MPQQFQCLQGHVWVAGGNDPALDSLTVIDCPVCGLSARLISRVALASEAPATVAFEGESVRELDKTSVYTPGSDEDSTSQAQPGEIDHVPGYQILGVLGRGGMGVVYRAAQIKLKRQVALKMVLGGKHSSPEGLMRFQHEAEAVARLQHPNIVQIYEVGQHQSLPYFSLEFVNAGSLAQFLNGTPQPPRVAAQFVLNVALAIHYAHQRGIVHRDLKPANILLHMDENRLGQTGTMRDLSAFLPKISDFGLAKHMEGDDQHTQTGTILGTPSYMAPEQARGQTHAIGPAADVYALGAILYELLTGRPPFRAATVMDTMQQVLTQDPVAPTRLQNKIPRDLETICLTCLRKDPNKRYNGADALAEDLRRFLQNEPILARRAGLAERVVKWAKRRPAIAALFVVSHVAGLVLLMLWGWFTVKLADERDIAQREQKNAEANFRRALMAVDQMLTEVAEDTLALEPRQEKKRRVLLEKALAFYQDFLEEKSDDLEVRKKTGVLYKKVADLQRVLGYPEKAEQSYQEAIAVLGKLAEELPEVPEYAHNLADSYNWCGELLRITSHPKRAATWFNKAKAAQEKLKEAYPREPVYRRDLARSYMNLGLVHKETGQNREALAAFAQAVEILEELQNQYRDPAYKRELARCLLNLGPALRRLGKEKELEAAEAYDRAISLLEFLVKTFPRDPEYRWELAIAHNNRGNFLGNRIWGQEAQNLALAEKDHRLALDLCDQVTADFPSVPAYRHERANTLNSLAAVLVRRKDFSAAEKAWDQAEKILHGLVKEFPAMANFQGDLGMTLGNLGWLKTTGKTPQWQSARACLEKAVPLVEAALKPNPKNPDILAMLRNQYRDLGKALLNLKDHQALATWVAHFTPATLNDKDDFFRGLFYLARCLALVEEDPKLAGDARKKLSTQYSVQALALLDQARARGCDLRDRLTDPVFDVLRKLPGFEKL